MKKLAVLAALLGMSAFAHHSFYGTYDENAPPATVEGTLRQFLFRNPHSFLTVEDDKLKDDKGAPILWEIEWSAGGQLGAQGITRDSLQAGDHVIVTGNQGRNPIEHRLYLRTVVRPSDGFHAENSLFTSFMNAAPIVLK